MYSPDARVVSSSPLFDPSRNTVCAEGLRDSLRYNSLWMTVA